jgi:hypothetical protein
MEKSLIDHLFDNKNISNEANEVIKTLTEEARDLAYLINEVCPDSHYKYTALRSISEAVMFVKHAIYHEIPQKDA